MLGQGRYFPRTGARQRYRLADLLRPIVLLERQPLSVHFPNLLVSARQMKRVGCPSRPHRNQDGQSCPHRSVSDKAEVSRSQNQDRRG